VRNAKMRKIRENRKKGKVYMKSGKYPHPGGRRYQHMSFEGKI
jgi:hypothetical protein